MVNARINGFEKWSFKNKTNPVMDYWSLICINIYIDLSSVYDFSK